MPEVKITRARLKDHFRRLWIAYLAGIALLCFLNNLAATIMRPSLSEEEVLRVMLIVPEAQMDADALGEALLSAAQAADARIQKVEFEQLAPLSAEDPAGLPLLAMQLTAGRGDLFIADACGLNALASLFACMALEGDALNALRDAGVDTAELVNAETGEAYAAAVRLRRSCLGTGEIYIAAAANATNKEGAVAVLEPLAAALTE